MNHADVGHDQPVVLRNVAQPARIAALPKDRRGFPVPWFVDWFEGEPYFPAFDPRKMAEAVKRKRCWVCGQVMGRWLNFVVGPMCTINRVSAEPPCHQECAEYSVKACPFLSNPAMRRVPHSKAPGGEGLKPPGGLMVEANPGLMALYVTRSYRIIKTSTGPIVGMGEPESVTWWARGRLATTEEARKGFDAGCVGLRRRALELDGAEAMPELERLVERARMWVP